MSNCIDVNNLLWGFLGLGLRDVQKAPVKTGMKWEVRLHLEPSPLRNKGGRFLDIHKIIKKISARGKKMKN